MQLHFWNMLNFDRLLSKRATFSFVRLGDFRVRLVAGAWIIWKLLSNFSICKKSILSHDSVSIFAIFSPQKSVNRHERDFLDVCFSFSLSHQITHSIWLASSPMLFILRWGISVDSVQTTAAESSKIVSGEGLKMQKISFSRSRAAILWIQIEFQLSSSLP